MWGRLEKGWRRRGEDCREVGKDVEKIGEDVGKIGERWENVEKIGVRGGECWRKVFEKRLAIVIY